MVLVSRIKLNLFISVFIRVLSYIVIILGEIFKYYLDNDRTQLGCATFVKNLEHNISEDFMSKLFF